MVKNSAIRFSDLKRIVGKMRCDGMTEGQIIQQVLYCFSDFDMVGGE